MPLSSASSTKSFHTLPFEYDHLSRSGTPESRQPSPLARSWLLSETSLDQHPPRQPHSATLPRRSDPFFAPTPSPSRSLHVEVGEVYLLEKEEILDDESAPSTQHRPPPRSASRTSFFKSSRPSLGGFRRPSEPVMPTPLATRETDWKSASPAEVVHHHDDSRRTKILANPSDRSGLRESVPLQSNISDAFRFPTRQQGSEKLKRKGSFGALLGSFDKQAAGGGGEKDDARMTPVKGPAAKASGARGKGIRGSIMGMLSMGERTESESRLEIRRGSDGSDVAVKKGKKLGKLVISEPLLQESSLLPSSPFRVQNLQPTQQSPESMSDPMNRAPPRTSSRADLMRGDPTLMSPIDLARGAHTGMSGSPETIKQGPKSSQGSSRFGSDVSGTGTMRVLNNLKEDKKEILRGAVADAQSKIAKGTPPKKRSMFFRRGSQANLLSDLSSPDIPTMQRGLLWRASNVEEPIPRSKSMDLQTVLRKSKIDSTMISGPIPMKKYIPSQKQTTASESDENYGRKGALTPSQMILQDTKTDWQSPKRQSRRASSMQGLNTFEVKGHPPQSPSPRRIQSKKSAPLLTSSPSYQGTPTMDRVRTQGYAPASPSPQRITSRGTPPVLTAMRSSRGNNTADVFSTKQTPPASVPSQRRAATKTSSPSPRVHPNTGKRAAENSPKTNGTHVDIRLGILRAEQSADNLSEMVRERVARGKAGGARPAKIADSEEHGEGHTSGDDSSVGEYIARENNIRNFLETDFDNSGEDDPQMVNVNKILGQRARPENEGRRETRVSSRHLKPTQPLRLSRPTLPRSSSSPMMNFAKELPLPPFLDPIPRSQTKNGQGDAAMGGTPALLPRSPVPKGPLPATPYEYKGNVQEGQTSPVAVSSYAWGVKAKAGEGYGPRVKNFPDPTQRSDQNPTTTGGRQWVPGWTEPPDPSPNSSVVSHRTTKRFVDVVLTETGEGSISSAYSSDSPNQRPPQLSGVGSSTMLATPDGARYLSAEMKYLTTSDETTRRSRILEELDGTIATEMEVLANSPTLTPQIWNDAFEVGTFREDELCTPRSAPPSKTVWDHTETTPILSRSGYDAPRSITGRRGSTSSTYSTEDRDNAALMALGRPATARGFEPRRMEQVPLTPPESGELGGGVRSHEAIRQRKLMLTTPEDGTTRAEDGSTQAEDGTAGARRWKGGKEDGMTPELRKLRSVWMSAEEARLRSMYEAGKKEAERDEVMHQMKTLERQGHRDLAHQALLSNSPSSTKDKESPSIKSDESPFYLWDGRSRASSGGPQQRESRSSEE